jgi:hypothetical protein
MLGEEPLQRDAHRHRNRRRNVRRHHEARESNPAQPVSRDEAFEAGKPPMKERTESAATPAAVIVTTLKSASGNKPNRTFDSDAKVHSSLGTYSLTLLRH